jgi:hypothetical protein
MLGERLAATMANVKDVHHLAVNGKQNPVHVGFATVEELAYVNGCAEEHFSISSSFQHPGRSSSER